MTAGIKKFSQYNALTGAALRGDETVLMADTASAGTVTAATISATAATNTISDSGGNLPVFKVGALALISGFVDAQAELNGLHTVVTSDANNLVLATDITADEAAGAEVTVSEVAAMYQGTLNELACFFNAAGVPNPLTGHAFKDSRHTAYDADSPNINVANGNAQTRTLAGNETIEVQLAGAQASYLHLVLIPGADTATLGTSFHKWIGDPPSTIGAEHHIMVVSYDGGVTNIARDLGAAA